MNTERTPETDLLYAKGMGHFREAQWLEAAQVFEELRSRSSAYPELEGLIADAQLKIELERTGREPRGRDRPRRTPWVPFVVIAIVLLLIAAAAFAYVSITATPAPTPTPVPTSSLSLPTLAPSSTPTVTNTPSPTPIPTTTPTTLPTVTPGPGTLIVRAAAGQSLTRTTGNIDIIFDASGSMLAQVGGQLKIDIARKALVDLVNRLPDGTNVALRTYGHRRASDCNDVELLVPLAPLNKPALLQRIAAINPVPNSLTPIGLSLQQVADDLKSAKGDSLVVLVSDGEEKCGADPPAIAAQLRATNPRLRVAVIGFGIGTSEERVRLSAIAERGGGTYFDATNAAQLADALQQVVALNYRVLGPDGKEVYSGPIGSQVELQSGAYTIEISGGDQLQVKDVNVGADIQAVVELSEENGRLKATVVEP